MEAIVVSHWILWAGPIQLAYAYHKAQLRRSLHLIRRPDESCGPPFALLKAISIVSMNTASITRVISPLLDAP